MALVGRGVLLIDLHLGAEAQRGADGLHPGKPGVAVVGRIVDLGIRRQNRLGVRAAHALGQQRSALVFIGLVEEIGQISRRLVPFCKVLAGLGHVAVDVDDGRGIGGVFRKDRVKRGIVHLGPLGDARVDGLGVHVGDDVFAHVGELLQIEQAAACAHLFEVEGEVHRVRAGVGAPPVLKVGVQKRQQVFDQALLREALFHKVAHRGLGVLALGELPLVAGLVVELHDLGGVHVLGHLKAAGLEQRDVLWHRGEPLLAADHVGGAHEVVVAHVGKVVGGDAVRLEQHLVDDVFGHFDLAADQILKGDALVLVAAGAEAQDPGLSVRQVLLDLLHAQIPAPGVFAKVAADQSAVLLLLVS